MAKEAKWPYFQIRQKENFKFGGEKLYPSTTAYVVWLHAEQRPLVCGEDLLGMDYDLGQNVAVFKNLGPEKVPLQLT